MSNAVHLDRRNGSVEAQLARACFRIFGNDLGPRKQIHRDRMVHTFACRAEDPLSNRLAGLAVTVALWNAGCVFHGNDAARCSGRAGD